MVGAKSRISKGMAGEVMRRLDEKDKAKPVRTKRTLVLTKNSYESFESLCRERGKYPSDVIDEFISLFVEQMT